MLAHVGTLRNTRATRWEPSCNGSRPLPALLRPVNLRDTQVREGLHRNGDKSDEFVATCLAGINKPI